MPAICGVSKQSVVFRQAEFLKEGTERVGDSGRANIGGEYQAYFEAVDAAAAQKIEQVLPCRFARIHPRTERIEAQLLDME